ncbi:uncharacterized protein LOC113218091 isoform X1 [Frankliniella occidentalis]|uniref:Uncharacterized protein LOC113218091 isoform X1 n=1 Tax=Frankliniella occidentalis TaxID=133901 RepID=A0A9C6XTM4_FRAOC|nr:uncharacterized protein LOC113218091 isoform X1 [Frankliniella occidentalis]
MDEMDLEGEADEVGVDDGPAPLKVGATYKTYKAFETALEAYQKKHSVVLVNYSSKLAEKHNLDHKDKVDLSLKYHHLVVVCKHFGKKRKNPKATNQRPNQKTFKVDCKCKLYLKATEEQVLIVDTFNEEHTNHPVDQKLFPMYPERRRLDEDERHKVEEMLGAKAKAMLVQATLKKFTTPQDIANVRTRLRLQTNKKFKSNMDHLYAVLTEISESGGTVIIGEERGDDNDEEEEDEDDSDETNNDRRNTDRKKKILFIFFQTAEMAKNFQEYPEVVGMDTTYCVNANNMPLVVFRVTDRYGKGKAAGYCIVANEKLDIMKESVMAFKEANSDHIQEVQTILVDKDYNEITVVKEILPWVHIHLCSVHVLGTFKKATKEETQKEELREILQKMVYSMTEERYKELCDSLPSVASETFLDYFNDNWANYGASWACYDRLNSLNLGQRTNNAVESHNQKIKTIVSRRNSLPELIKALLILQVSCDNVTNYNDFLGLMKMSYRTDTTDPNIKLMLNSATPFAAECMRVEYQEGLRRVKLPDNVNYKNWQPTLKDCPCPIFKERRLPCRHMFCFRVQKDVTVFSSVDVPSRWQTVSEDNFRTRQEDMPTSYIPDGILRTEVLKTGGKPLNQRERYKEASDLALEAAKAVAYCAGKQYASRMKCLDDIIQIWLRGKEAVVLEAGKGNNGIVVIDVVEQDTQEVDSSAIDDVRNKDTQPGNGVDHSTSDVRNEDAQQANEENCSSTDDMSRNDNITTIPENDTCRSDANPTSDDLRNISTTALTQKVVGASNKYTPLTAKQMRKLKVQEGNKVRGRPKGQVLTRIGLKKKVVKKVECDVCKEKGVWRKSTLRISGGTNDFFLCPGCRDEFMDEMLPSAEEEEREDDPDNLIDDMLPSAEEEEREDDPDNLIDDMLPSAEEEEREDDPDNLINESSHSEDEGIIASQRIPSASNCNEVIVLSSDDEYTPSPPENRQIKIEFDATRDSAPHQDTPTLEDTLAMPGNPSMLDTPAVQEIQAAQEFPSGVRQFYIPKCSCGTICERKTCRSGPNLGREYFLCPDESCSNKKFRWVNTLSNVSPSKTLSPIVPPEQRKFVTQRKRGNIYFVFIRCVFSSTFS